MINGLEGVPRSGKSYEATVYHALHALACGRMIITNLPLFRDKFMAIDPSYGSLIQIKRRPSPILGTWDANRVDDEGKGNAFELFADGHQEPADVTQSVFGGVWDYYTTWKHPETGQGPLFLIDEAHVPLPSIGTAKAVIEWFKLHGHFNIDVLLMTQSFRDLNQPIARLIEMLIRVRKATFLGKSDRYIRKVYAGYRGAVISTEERPYKSQFFGLYKSHTQGNSVAEASMSDVAPFLVRFKRWSWVVIAVGVVIVVATIGNKTIAKTKTVTTQVIPLDSAQNAATAVIAPLPRPSASAPQTVEIPAPYDTKSFHLTGRITMGEKTVYTFAVSQNGLIVASVTNQDLERTGYKWAPMTDCAGTLFWDKRAIPITCDAPQVSMAAAGPLADSGKKLAVESQN